MRILPSKTVFASGITDRVGIPQTDRRDMRKGAPHRDLGMQNLRKMKEHCMLSVKRVQCGKAMKHTQGQSRGNRR